MEQSSQAVALIQGPESRQSYFKLLQDQLDPMILNDIAADPIKEAVFEGVLNGSTVIDTSLNAADQQKKVFGFISNQTNKIIKATMKHLGTSMDNLEKKHYEQKFAKLEQ